MQIEALKTKDPKHLSQAQKNLHMLLTPTATVIDPTPANSLTMHGRGVCQDGYLFLHGEPAYLFKLTNKKIEPTRSLA